MAGVGDTAGAPTTSGAPWAWDEMLAEFRRLGGVAENVRLGKGRRGRGLFPIDPARPVRIHVPPELLVPCEAVAVRGNRLSIRPDAAIAPELRSFFDRYEENYSFGAGVAEECRDLLAARANLPQPVRAHIDAIMLPAGNRFAPPSDETMLEQYLRTRAIEAGGRKVLMPLMALLNHSSAHRPFDLRNGVTVGGSFDEEILVSYSISDTWEAFMIHGAVFEQPIAFSIRVQCRLPNGNTLRIGRNFDDVRAVDQMPAPKVERVGDGLNLSHFMLGHREAPALPRTICRMVMQEEGIADYDTLFDLVAHTNRSWYYRLLSLLEDESGAATGPMRRAAMRQLETLSFAVGTLQRR